jgi:predicted DNA-binding transcriptional regulator AlpA
MESNESNAKYLTLAEVRAEIPSAPHRVSIWRWIRRGQFPAPVQIGQRKLVWRATEVNRWLAERGVEVQGGSNNVE